MDDFYKKIKDNLEQREEPSVRKGAWQAMQTKLAAKDEKKRKGGGFFWWLPLLGLLLVGSSLLNLYLFKQLNNDAQRPSSSTAYAQATDTIIQTKIIYRTDTVFQTNIQKSVVHHYYPQKNTRFTTSYNQPNQQAPKPSLLFADLIDFTPTNKSPLWSDPLSQSTETKLAPQRFAPLDLLQRSIAMLNPEAPQSTFSALLPLPAKKKKISGNPLHQLRPKHIALGLNFGIAYPAKREDIEVGTNYHLGLQVDIAMADNFRLFATANYAQLHYESDEFNEDLGIFLVDPPSEGFVFENADVFQPSFQYAIGAKYLWNSKNKFKPYLGLAYAATALLPYEITYDFRSDQTGVEIALDKVINQRLLITNQVLLQVGWEYSFYNNWSWQFHGSYRRNMNEVKVNASNAFGLQTGLLYHFR